LIGCRCSNEAGGAADRRYDMKCHHCDTLLSSRTLASSAFFALCTGDAGPSSTETQSESGCEHRTHDLFSKQVFTYTQNREHSIFTRATASSYVTSVETSSVGSFTATSLWLCFKPHRALTSASTGLLALNLFLYRSSGSNEGLASSSEGTAGDAKQIL